MESLQKIISNPWVYAALVVVLTPFAGALLTSIDRKLTARMQGRIGPSWFQPLYDVAKLFSKKPMALHRPQLIYATLHLVFMVVAVVLLALGCDLLMVLFVQAFSMICLVLGGMSVRSPYSWIGSQRKIIQMLGVEPVFLVMILALYLRNGSFLGSALFSKAEPLLLSMPLMFLAFLCAIAIEMEKSPFDLASSHHAHQEVVKGVTLEYSGPFLGLIEIAHFYEFAFFFGLMMAFWHTNIIIGLIVAFAGLVFMSVLDNSFARLTPNWMLRFMWTVPLSMALANLIWLWVK
ncbi:MAG: NADH-quinone oxidoreductase subunit H [Lentisphaeria bacterium]|nr:NADH-quinone oxidoreductase subunit H [Lentisphaerota bacterium]MBR7145492.1 NADH-quinone oxidoreductase subunit H [Lentisphaeria bacterium]